MKRKIILIVLCIIAAFLVWRFSIFSVTEPAMNNTTAESPATPPIKTLTVGWTGDMVPATDPAYDLTVLDNVSDTLGVPNLMIGNLEGTFAHPGRTSKCTGASSNCYAFAGDSSFADTLKAAGFDFISLMNNHSLDYGMPGLLDTETELNRVGLPYIAPNKPTDSITVNGVTIGIMGVSSTPPATITNYAYIAQTVEALKKNNDIVIVIFHGGAEGADETQVSGGEEYEDGEDRGNVQAVAYTAINAGANLVLGDGPHVLRKTEYYHNGLIAYSLGNFVGGNGRLGTAGNLGLGGIFTATFQNNPISDIEEVQQNYSFTSVVLAADGTPSLDPTNKAQQLLDSLSNINTPGK